MPSIEDNSDFAISMIPTSTSLDDVIDWIQANMQPEEVFSKEDLQNWTDNNKEDSGLQGLIKIADEWNKLETDSARWAYLMGHTAEIGLHFAEYCQPFFKEKQRLKAKTPKDVFKLNLKKFIIAPCRGEAIFALLKELNIDIIT